MSNLLIPWGGVLATSGLETLYTNHDYDLFAVNEVVRADNTNAAIRQSSLTASAVLSCLLPSTTLTIDSSLTDLTEALATTVLGSGITTEDDKISFSKRITSSVTFYESDSNNTLSIGVSALGGFLQGAELTITSPMLTLISPSSGTIDIQSDTLNIAPYNSNDGTLSVTHSTINIGIHNNITSSSTISLFGTTYIKNGTNTTGITLNKNGSLTATNVYATKLFAGSLCSLDDTDGLIATKISSSGLIKTNDASIQVFAYGNPVITLSPSGTITATNISATNYDNVYATGYISGKVGKYSSGAFTSASGLLLPWKQVSSTQLSYNISFSGPNGLYWVAYYVGGGTDVYMDIVRCYQNDNCVGLGNHVTSSYNNGTFTITATNITSYRIAGAGLLFRI